MLRIMAFLDFSDVSFLPNSSIGELCEDEYYRRAEHLVRYISSSKYKVVMTGEWYCYDS